MSGFTPDPCLSLNGLRRSHWRTIQAARDTAKWWVVEALCSAAPLPHYHQARAEVVFTYPSARHRDLDNQWALTKPLFDTLVEYGVIEADDFDHLRAAVVLKVRRGVRETRITIKPMNEEWNPS